MFDLNELKDKVLDIPFVTKNNIISELSGAIKADLHDIYANIDKFEINTKTIDEEDIEMYIYVFNNFILNTREDFLASAILRIIMIAKRYNIILKYIDSPLLLKNNSGFIDNCYEVIDIIDCWTGNISDLLQNVIFIIKKIIDKYNIDILKFINARIKYEKNLRIKSMSMSIPSENEN